MLSFTSVLDASALATKDLSGIDLVCDKTRPVGAASLLGSSRSKLLLFAHPARPRAKSAAKNHFMFTPVMRGVGNTHHLLSAGTRRSETNKKVSDLFKLSLRG